MNEKFIKGITIITRQFVEEVEMQMLQEARNLYKNEWFVNMVVSFYDRYMKELESDFQEAFRFFGNNDIQDFTHFTVLEHSKSYRDVIVDILQKK